MVKAINYDDEVVNDGGVIDEKPVLIGEAERVFRKYVGAFAIFCARLLREFGNEGAVPLYSLWSSSGP